MIGLRTIGILLVLSALTFGVIGHGGKHHPNHDHDHGHDHNMDGHFPHKKPCTHNPDLYAYYPPCSDNPNDIQTSTETTPAPVKDDSSEESAENLSTTSATTTVGPTSLERAHWCRFPNGTYVPLNFSYIRNTCTLCQCTKSRAIRCQLLQCMPTYCLDHKMPVRKAGQCCTQCEHDFATNSSCFYNGIDYPHG